MAEVELNPSVAKLSPNFAEALRKSSLPPGSSRVVEQYARSQTLGKKLIGMPKDQAREEFLSLDPIVRNNIYSLYSNQEIFAPEKSLGMKILSGVTGAVTDTIALAASPLIAGFKLADTWDKTFKTAGNVLQSVRGGKTDFSRKVLTDSFNGKNMWRADSLKEYESKYGVALVTLARGLAEQRTPGESIDLYGKFDEDMANAIRFMGDNQEMFDDLVLQLKQNVQMSPGRNVANTFVSKARMSTPLEIATAKKSPWYKIAKTFGIDVATEKGQQQASGAISGTLDAIYSIMNPADPLTYTGFVPAARAARKGIAGGVQVTPLESLRFAGYKSRGEQLADQYKFIANKFGETGIRQATRAIFKEPDVRLHWNEGIGPLVKQYAEATSPARKGAAYRNIMQTYPEWADENVVKLFADAKAFDADKAEYFFQEFENGRYLLSMSVDGISQTRNGIPVAKRYRERTTQVHKAFYNVFNPTPETAEEFDKLDKIAADTIKMLSKTGEGTSLISKELDEVIKLNKERTTFIKKMGVLASRSPQRILYGDDAIKSIREVRNLATLVVGKDVAEAVAQLYVKLAPEYQITVVRNLHDAYYRAIGMHGSINGSEHAAELLSKTFNEKAGFLNTVRSEIPQGWEVDLERSIFKYENDVPVIQSRGAIHPAQLTEGIAPINFDMALEYAAHAKLDNSFAFFNMIGGATRNAAVRRYQNFWVTQTLFPRLGNRTSIDEGFMISLQDSYVDLLDLSMGKLGGIGTAQRDISTMVSGSKAGVGMYKRGLYKMFPHLDLTKKIDAEARTKNIEELAEKAEVSVAEVSQAAIMLDTTNRAIQLYGKTMPKQVWDTVKLVMKHNPQMLDSMASSLGSRSTLSGNIDVDYMQVMFRQSAWTETLKDFGLEQGPNYVSKLTSQMNELEVAIAHWDNWQTRFTSNQQKVDKGVTINPVNYFLNNNALKDSKDLVKARNAMLERVGVTYDSKAGVFVAEKPELLKKFIGPYSTTVWLREAGNTDAQIAKAHIETMLIDLKNVFHGTTNAFNNSFYNLIKAKRDTIIANSDGNPNIVEDAWAVAARSLSFKEFADVTSAYQPVGEINTRLIKVAKTDFDMKSFEELGRFEDVLNRYQNWTMDVMDATVTGLLRQKLVWFKITKNLNELKPFEANIKNDIINNAKMANPYLEGAKLEAVKVAAANAAESRLVNLAYEKAVSDVIAMVDNPTVRSNLAVSVRSVGRFYRATEDFQRRAYRLYTQKPLRALMRMRLLQTGLQAHGDVYTDEKGDQYLVFPTDALVNNAVEPIMRIITGNDTFKVPSFSDMAVKLRLINPSFSPDAGQPSLSGPIGAVSMIGVKALLNELPFVPKEWKQEGVDIINEIALGDIGKNLDLYRALTPMFAQSILGTLTPVERDRQKSSAMLSVIAAFQAYGYGLPSNATAEQKREYINKLKISVFSLLAFRNFAGNISPGQPTLKETNQLTDAVKRAGISSPKSEFWDVYNGILRNSESDLGNTFDLAVMTWIGKNPGKSAWIVPRNEKSYKVFINKTNEVKDWAVKNSDFVDTYKEIAWIFSPRAGEYNPDIYNWMQSEGLISSPEFENYLLAVQLQTDKIAYFGIDKERDEKLKNSNDIVTRKQAMDEATFKKRMMRAASPELAADVESNLESQGELEVKFKALNEAVENPKSPINKMTRTAMQLIIKDIKSLQEYSLDVNNRIRFDFSLTKSEMKDKIEAGIKEVGTYNPEINEASRLIFTPLLNMLSKDTISAGARD